METYGAVFNMKTTIRMGMFETNSSSTHAFIYLSEEDWERWIKKEIELMKSCEFNETWWKEHAFNTINISDFRKSKNTKKTFTDSRKVCTYEDLRLWYEELSDCCDKHFEFTRTIDSNSKKETIRLDIKGCN